MTEVDVCKYLINEDLTEIYDSCTEFCVFLCIPHARKIDDIGV